MANEIYIKSRNELILENILGADNVLPAPVSLTETLLTCWLNGDKYTDEIYDPSRNTSALLAIVNGTTYDAAPTCEIEALLAAIANGTDPDPSYLPPKSRIGALLYEIYSNQEFQILNDESNWARMTISTQKTETEIGTTGSYYSASATRLTTVPETLTANSLPGYKLNGVRTITISCAAGYRFGLRGYNADVSEQTTIIPLGTNEGVTETVDVSGYSYINLLFAPLGTSTIPIQDFSKIQIIARK